MKKWLFLSICLSALIVEGNDKMPTPLEVWKDYDPDKGDFEEEVIREETRDGIYKKESYVSAYANGQEVRVYCIFAVKAGAQNSPGLLNIHGWMSQAGIDMDYVKDGWAVMSYDYCGKTGDRKEYTKYPESLRHCNMDAKESGGAINSRLKDGSNITDPRQTSDYVWCAMQRRVLSYLLTQKEVDRNRIGAKGYSYGGTIIWNLGMDTRVKAIVAYFGIGWLEYYRNKRVWMYEVPYKEPPKTPGEELYLSAIAPQAHAPYITAASLWLNGSNDHHGGHERGEQTFKMFRKDIPWSFAHQARGHHNTEKLGDNCRIWLEKYVLGKDGFWPARPRSEIKLDAEGVPEFSVSPASPEKVTSLEMYYALKNPVSFGRVWRDAEAIREGDVWKAKMPVLNVDDYLFAFANIRYENNTVLSSDFTAAIPSKLGNAVATDKLSTDISEDGGSWSDTAPVEGVGGVKGFRATDNQRGTANERLSDPKWKAPEGAELTFKFYCTQPQDIIMVVNDWFEAEIEITASNEWQSMALQAGKLIHRGNKNPMGDWSQAAKIQLKPEAGQDITKVVFADFKWDISKTKEPKQMEIKPDAQGKVHLTREMASKTDSFWQVMNDKSVEGKNRISIGGTSYERGLGVHAPSEISFPLNAQFKTFHVVPGPDDTHHGQIEMKILLDGTEVFSSGKVGSQGYTSKALDLPVTDGKILTLIVTDAGDTNGGDHASWGDAYLMK